MPNSTAQSLVDHVAIKVQQVRVAILRRYEYLEAIILGRRRCILAPDNVFEAHGDAPAGVGYSVTLLNGCVASGAPLTLHG